MRERKRGVSPKSLKWYTQQEENTMKKTMRWLCILLGMSGIGMLFLAPIIGFVMLMVAASVALVIALRDGDGGDDMGSYRMPRI